MLSRMFSRGSALLLLGLLAAGAQATEQAQLADTINLYRSQVQRCAQQVSEPLPPLSVDTRLQLPLISGGDLQQELAATGYPLERVQAVSLSGPRDAQAAIKVLNDSFCKVLLDPQFINIGISQAGRDWRIVLARPLLSGKLGDAQSEGQKLLEQINVARAQARRCGSQAFAAATQLNWSAALGGAAQSHSRAMANGNFFAHLDQDGRTPGDRAELAGYEGGQVGENIAAALDAPAKVVEGWLASPAHCANLMSPNFSELGAAYASDPQSDAGIYWTALFGAP